MILGHGGNNHRCIAAYLYRALGFLSVTGWFSLCSNKHHIRQNVLPTRCVTADREEESLARDRKAAAARGKPQQEPPPRFLQQLQTSAAPAAARSLSLPPAASARAQKGTRSFPLSTSETKGCIGYVFTRVRSLFYM